MVCSYVDDVYDRMEIMSEDFVEEQKLMEKMSEDFVEEQELLESFAEVMLSIAAAALKKESSE